FSITTPSVQYTFDVAQVPTSIDRRIDLNTRWRDGAFQELGVLSSPTPFDYRKLPAVYPNQTDPIDFTMSVSTKMGDNTLDDVQVPVFLDTQTDVGTIDDLVARVQTAVDGALKEAFLGRNSTTLSSGINATATSLTVADGSNFPTTNFLIRIDDELIRVASRS